MGILRKKRWGIGHPYPRGHLERSPCRHDKSKKKSGCSNYTVGGKIFSGGKVPAESLG